MRHCINKGACLQHRWSVPGLPTPERHNLRSHPEQKGSAVRDQSQSLLRLYQANIEAARGHLLEMSRLLCSWREFNKAAAIQLSGAHEWKSEEADKVKAVAGAEPPTTRRVKK
jgi:hypothetical protein